ncbi:AMP-binding protein, partial [Streptomyces sp. NPDC057675]|uniref:AMP-binding protein n=1 Tax=Streptomyces sp. NPDC057675 TaxID=3346204 RepID=UPI0036B1DDB4
MSVHPFPETLLTETRRAATNGTPREIPDTVIHEMVDRWAEKTPEGVALSGAHGTVTYQELVHRANQLGHYLVSAGARRGTRVGVLLPRGTDAVIACLAVLKTGCAYVPLDPALPQDRLDYMTGDAELVSVLTAERLERDRELIAAQPDTSPIIATRNEDIAYVIYTSGSTGRPKGVEITHRSVLDLVTCADHTRLGPGSRLLHAASVSFDAAVLEVWSALLTG